MHAKGDFFKVSKICCIGAGILGVPHCAVLATQHPDIQVSVVDDDVKVINEWNSDCPPIKEPGLQELLVKCLGRNLIISSSVEEYIAVADIILICAKTPTKSLGIGRGRAADLTCIEMIARKIADTENKSSIVVVQSTVPITATELIQSIFQANCPTLTPYVLTNPQFISEGNVIHNLLYPDRVIIGGNLQSEVSLWAINVLKSIYTKWVPEENIVTMSTRSAEVSKLVTNAILAQRISSINAMSSVCEETEADVRQVADAVGRDSRVGPQFLQASLGFGGNTLPSDLHHLVYTCEVLKQPVIASYWNSVLTVNDFQVSRFFRKITAHYCETLKNKRIAMFGCAFKSGTPEVKNSPAITIICCLLKEECKVSVYDPLATKALTLDAITSIMGTVPAGDNSIEWCSSPEQAANGSDGIIISNDCDQFKNLDYANIYQYMRKPCSVFDGRLVVDHKLLQSIGFRVEAVGVSLK